MRSCWAAGSRPSATAAIVRSVSITRCAASRRYSGVYVLLFFVDPIKDILSGQFRQGNPPRRCPGYGVNLSQDLRGAKGRLAVLEAILRGLQGSYLNIDIDSVDAD